MAKNMGVRRAAKAQRRNAIVADKRKAEADTKSLAGQARLAAAEPVQHCLVAQSSSGMSVVVLARGETPYRVTMGMFLLDTHGPGVKDVILRPLDRSDFLAYVETMSVTAPMEAVEPSYARKLLHDLTAWSRSHGFNPHPDYVKVEQIFGGIDPNACDATFDFGQDGKPVLIADLPDDEWDLDEDDDDAIEGTADEVTDVGLSERQ